MNKPVYINKMKVNSDLDKIDRIISIFSIIKNGNLGVTHIRKRCSEVLSYYILFGYGAETRKLIQNSLSITKENLHAINSELTGLGYLVKDSNNFHNKHISEELLRIKEYFLEDAVKDKLFLIQVIE